MTLGPMEKALVAEYASGVRPAILRAMQSAR
jgi:hypothetical protein